MNELERKCPQCGKILTYSSKGALTTANKKGGVCRKCASINSGFTARYATKGKNCGKDNPQYGRELPEWHKEILRNTDKSYTKTDKFRQTMSRVTSGKNNPMYGRTPYEIWIEKYGKEKADRLHKEWCKKHSVNNSGSGNPMYGKPSPNGSGNGWKGWYKEIFFRSLRELMYLIYLDENNIEWVNGETLRIKYKDYKGKDRTYRPDFIHDGMLVEIKPKRLQNTPTNLSKRKAAEAYCVKVGLKHKYVDPEIDCVIIKKHIDNNDIKFNGDYLKRFNDYVKKDGIS